MASDKTALEIESLNLEDLDVEELEHRVELATTSVGLECYINCNCDGLVICDTNSGDGGGGGCNGLDIEVPIEV